MSARSSAALEHGASILPDWEPRRATASGDPVIKSKVVASHV